MTVTREDVKDDEINLSNYTPLEEDMDIEIITPAMATEYLNSNTANRNIRNRVVESYARDIREGNWQFTGEAIKFSREGVLLDGQHRLYAIIEANAPIKALVIRNLADESQEVMDTGAKRAAADALSMKGYKNATTLAAAARYVITFKSGSLQVNKEMARVTHSEIIDFLSKNAVLEEYTVFCIAMKATSDLSPSIMVASLFLLAESDKEAAMEFMTTVGTGLNLQPNTSIYALLNRLREIRRHRTYVPPAEYLSLVIRAWNKWRKGESVKTLPLRTSGNNTIKIPSKVL